MIRTILAASMLVAAAMPAAAAPLLGDFECVSDLGGPDTFHGTLRIEEPTKFSFLTEDFMPGEQFPLDMSDPGAVLFTGAFAEQISAGATMVKAEIINLRNARKQQARVAKQTQAAQNRVLFGRTKAEKLQQATEKAMAAKHIDGHKKDQ